jgi:hypothetical protein
MLNRESIFSLLFESFQVASLAFELSLIRVDLPLLIGLPVLLTLKLISDQRAGTQTDRPANGSARTGMANRGADNTSYGCASESADTGAFFAGAQRPSGATKSRKDKKHRNECKECIFHGTSI